MLDSNTLTGAALVGSYINDLIEQDRFAEAVTVMEYALGQKTISYEEAAAIAKGHKGDLIAGVKSDEGKLKALGPDSRSFSQRLEGNRYLNRHVRAIHKLMPKGLCSQTEVYEIIVCLLNRVAADAFLFSAVRFLRDEIDQVLDLLEEPAFLSYMPDLVEDLVLDRPDDSDQFQSEMTALLLLMHKEPERYRELYESVPRGTWKYVRSSLEPDACQKSIQLIRQVLDIDTPAAQTSASAKTKDASALAAGKDADALAGTKGASALAAGTGTARERPPLGRVEALINLAKTYGHSSGKDRYGVLDYMGKHLMDIPVRKMEPDYFSCFIQVHDLFEDCMSEQNDLLEGTLLYDVEEEPFDLEPYISSQALTWTGLCVLLQASHFPETAEAGLLLKMKLYMTGILASISALTDFMEQAADSCPKFQVFVKQAVVLLRQKGMPAIEGGLNAAIFHVLDQTGTHRKELQDLFLQIYPEWNDMVGQSRNAFQQFESMDHEDDACMSTVVNTIISQFLAYFLSEDWEFWLPGAILLGPAAGRLETVFANLADKTDDLAEQVLGVPKSKDTKPDGKNSEADSVFPPDLLLKVVMEQIRDLLNSGRLYEGMDEPTDSDPRETNNEYDDEYEYDDDDGVLPEEEYDGFTWLTSTLDSFKQHARQMMDGEKACQQELKQFLEMRKQELEPFLEMRGQADAGQTDTLVKNFPDWKNVHSQDNLEAILSMKRYQAIEGWAEMAASKPAAFSFSLAAARQQLEPLGAQKETKGRALVSAIRTIENEIGRNLEPWNPLPKAAEPSWSRMDPQQKENLLQVALLMEGILPTLQILFSKDKPADESRKEWVTALMAGLLLARQSYREGVIAFGNQGLNLFRRSMDTILETMSDIMNNRIRPDFDLDALSNYALLHRIALLKKIFQAPQPASRRRAMRDVLQAFRQVVDYSDDIYLESEREELVDKEIVSLWMTEKALVENALQMLEFYPKRILLITTMQMIQFLTFFLMENSVWEKMDFCQTLQPILDHYMGKGAIQPASLTASLPEDIPRP